MAIVVRRRPFAKSFVEEMIGALETLDTPDGEFSPVDPSIAEPAIAQPAIADEASEDVLFDEATTDLAKGSPDLPKGSKTLVFLEASADEAASAIRAKTDSFLDEDDLEDDEPSLASIEIFFDAIEGRYADSSPTPDPSRPVPATAVVAALAALAASVDELAARAARPTLIPE